MDKGNDLKSFITLRLFYCRESNFVKAEENVKFVKYCVASEPSSLSH